ncbi:MAG: hypothetical protein H3C47_13740 [Candidatus Cloacimonetes bacterium]|nr:hypothetical protein [Candidatus Cloacimonadota bacterium]
MKKDIKEEFIHLSLRYIDGIKNGPLSRSNAACKKLRQICKVKCESDDKGHKFFSELIAHDEPAVRLWAATFLYLSDPIAATAEFQALEKLRVSHVSAFAFGSLLDIKNGNYKIIFD